jgi:PAP2 superfamily
MKQTVTILFLLFVTDIISAQDSMLANLEKPTGRGICIYKDDTLNFQKPKLFRNLGYVPADIWQIAKAPFQKKNLVGLSAVAATTTLLIIKDESIIKWVRKTSDEIGLIPETNYKILIKAGDTKILKIPRNVNTTLYQMGEGGTSMVLATGLWIFGKIRNSWRDVNAANDLAETFVTMGVTTQILKRMTGRESPFMKTEPGGRWVPFPAFKEFQQNTSAYDAFPSGHLSTLMATITVLSADYPEKKWIKPAGYSLMCLSAWAMMNTEVHWAGDYPLAIAIGYLSGKITTWRHRKNSKSVVKAVAL